MSHKPIYWESITEIGDQPTKKGWYGIRYYWDYDEGSFTGIDYWTGTDWKSELPICSYTIEPFASENEAQTWLDKEVI